MECQHKHTKYQPTDEEWKCPKCGVGHEDGAGWTLYDSPDDGTDGVDCLLLHNDDTLFCEKCSHSESGKTFALRLLKKHSFVTCPCCKGTGLVKKDKDHG